MTHPRKKNQHHHGNLRDALITAGIEILKEGGLSALTLRACAARAGVSHAAPAHHFEGLAGLLTAISARGYRTFTDAMTEERQKASADPHARLMAICRGYLKFADEHSALFTLMFNTRFDAVEDEELAVSSRAAYEVLSDGCAPFHAPEVGSAGNEIMVWSLVHGFACLQLSGCFGPQDDAIRPIQFEDIFPKMTLR